MCAINPVHKKRMVFDVYTSHRNMIREEFDRRVAEALLEAEIELNTNWLSLRFHLKESNQEAD